jgi:hypothetical protein
MQREHEYRECGLFPPLNDQQERKRNPRPAHSLSMPGRTQEKSMSMGGPKRENDWDLQNHACVNRLSVSDLPGTIAGLFDKRPFIGMSVATTLIKSQAFNVHNGYNHQEIGKFPNNYTGSY